MIVEYDKSFGKSLDQLKDKSLFAKIDKLIDSLELSPSLSSIPNVKKLTGYKSYYRFRIGEYRVGFEIINENTIRLIVVAHRKKIYRIFP